MANQWLLQWFCNGSATVLQWLLLTVAMAATAPILLKAVNPVKTAVAMATTAPFLLTTVNPVNTPVAMALQWFCNGVL